MDAGLVAGIERGVLGEAHVDGRGREHGRMLDRGIRFRFLLQV